MLLRAFLSFWLTILCAGQPDAKTLRAVAITAGGSTILREDGRVVSFKDPNSLEQPVLVQGATSIIAVAGSNPGWALRNDGTVLAWEAKCTEEEQPTCRLGTAKRVEGLRDIVGISERRDVYLALQRDGTVWGLGDDR
jgi:hypothetical protein